MKCGTRIRRQTGTRALRTPASFHAGPWGGGGSSSISGGGGGSSSSSGGGSSISGGSSAGQPQVITTSLFSKDRHNSEGESVTTKRVRLWCKPQCKIVTKCSGIVLEENAEIRFRTPNLRSIARLGQPLVGFYSN
jgi:hypothetical protein